ncbi:MAG: FAD-dependent oxidoreductase [Syntrophales bacterium]|nr:FAD-dependent oxidoreductase [Syntrophales bacterium]
MDKKTEATQKVSLFIPRSYLTTEGNKTGSWRFLRPRYEEKTAPCSVSCPAAEDIGMIQMLTTQGSFKDAWETILRENPFPGVCGRVCFHPCEGVCNRAEFDEAVAIHVIERFLANTAHRNAFTPEVERLAPKKQNIAVIGAGPGGLSAAYFLALLGYKVDVFEGAGEPGGVLRWGIPSYRLPLAILKEEIRRIEEIGVRIQTGKPLVHRDLDTLGKEYNALFLACGHGRSMALGIPGEELEGVQDGLSFLRGIREGRMSKFSGRVAVIGGGNAAIDVARSIIRLGGKALIIYRRRRQDMPAFGEEIEMALDEGVELRELRAPVSIRKAGGNLALEVRSMKIVGTDTDGRAHIEPEEGKPEEIKISHLVAAIGERAEEPWYEPPDEGTGVLHLSHCVMAHKPGGTLVYGGDLTNGIKSVAHAVASGKEAALALDSFFTEGIESVQPRLAACRAGAGPALSMEIYTQGPRSDRSTHVVTYDEINADYFQFDPRVKQPRLLREERSRTFGEVSLKISANLAIRETERCFNCGLCNQCDNCYLFCPDLAVKKDSEALGRHIDYDYCKGCGICAVECPRNALILEEEDYEEGH